MTAEEIQECNKQIALMLNIKIEQCYPENKDYKQHGVVYTLEREFAKNVNSIFLGVSELKFHKDWNWLHEAVEKVYSLLDPSDSIKHDITQLLGRNQKEAVFIALSDFAQKFNNKEL